MTEKDKHTQIRTSKKETKLSKDFFYLIKIATTKTLGKMIFCVNTVQKCCQILSPLWSFWNLNVSPENIYFIKCSCSAFKHSDKYYIQTDIVHSFIAPNITHNLKKMCVYIWYMRLYLPYEYSPPPSGVCGPTVQFCCQNLGEHYFAQKISLSMFCSCRLCSFV